MDRRWIFFILVFCEFDTLGSCDSQVKNIHLFFDMFCNFFPWKKTSSLNNWDVTKKVVPVWMPFLWCSKKMKNDPWQFPRSTLCISMLTIPLYTYNTGPLHSSCVENPWLNQALCSCWGKVYVPLSCSTSCLSIYSFQLRWCFCSHIFWYFTRKVWGRCQVQEHSVCPSGMIIWRLHSSNLR